MEDTFLLFGTFIICFALSLGLYRNPLLRAISSGERLPESFFSTLRRPFAVFSLAIRTKQHHFLRVFWVFAIFILTLTFLYLRFNFSIFSALAWFFPITFAIILITYYIMWFTTLIVTRIIDVGNPKFNVIFAVVFFDLLFIFIEYLLHTDPDMHYTTFALIFINLCIGYFLTGMAMKMVLNEITVLQTLTFSHHNLWKVALTLLIEFLVELTFFAYLGVCFFDDPFNQPVNLFDVFYYTVITFGTVGYGDIYPTIIYTKITAILTTFTSITCIGIMLSSFLSAAPATKKRKK
jgi:hypothetical protein